MAKAPKVGFRVVDGRPQLELELTSVELGKLGELKGVGNVDALRQVRHNLPIELVEPKAVAEGKTSAEDLRQAGRSLKNLYALAGGHGSKIQHNAGSSVAVVIKKARRGGEVYRAEPQEPKPVADLRARVAQIKAALLHDYQLVGVPMDDIQSQLDALDVALNTYRRVFELSQSGASQTEIASKLGVGARQVYSWLSNERAPSLIAHQDPQFRSKYVKDVDIPRGFSKEFAYLLGAHAGVTMGTHHSNQLAFESTEREVIERLQNSVNAILKPQEGEALKIRERQRPWKDGSNTFYGLVVLRDRLTAYVNGITEGNGRLPWEHLVGEKEKVAFLQGFLDFAGGVIGKERKRGEGKVTHYMINVVKGGNDRLLKEVAILLKGLGVLPTVQTGTKVALSIYGKSNLARLVELGGYTSPEMQAKLVAGSQVDTTRTEYTPQDYDKAKQLRLQQPDKKAVDIAVAVGIEYSVVRGWVDEGAKPNSVLRREAIEAFERELPDPEVVGFCFRELGMESTLARDIAGKRRMTEVRENIKLLGQHGRDVDYVKKHPELLALSKEELMRALQGLTPAEERPLYANQIDNLIRGWDGLKDPFRIADFLTISLSVRHGESRDRLRRYILDRLDKEKPNAHERYSEHLEKRGEPEDEWE